MKIAIISDIHDNLANLKRFLELAKELGIESIICCGDVTTPETLEELVKNFTGTIKLVCGNAEIRREEFFDVAKRCQNLEVFAEKGEWEIEGLKLAFIHRPDRVRGLSGPSVDKESHQFIFYGHTHQPWIRIVPEDGPSGAVQGPSSGTTIAANPGTLGGFSTTPTFAILDTETRQLELKKLYS